MNALLLSLLLTNQDPLFQEPTEFGASSDAQCILGFADNLDAQLILTSTENQFSILQPSTTGHSIETRYEKYPIALFQEPVEAPLLECKDENAMIIVWENLVSINGQYFALENGTAIHEN